MGNAAEVSERAQVTVGNISVVSVLLALLAALLFASASVAQHSAASAVPEGASLIGTLIKSPRWWAGLVGDGGGYLCQVLALSFGSVLTVQPLLVTMLLFALPLSARFSGRPMTRKSWLLALALASALAVFIVVGDPTPGVTDAPFRRWAVPLFLALAVIGVAAITGLVARNPTTRALLLGAAGGLLFGVAAVLTKYVTDLLTRSPVSALEAWQTYALVACGATGFYVQQRSFQTGPLSASLPAVTVGEPIVAAFLGIAVLGERVRTGSVDLIIISIAVLVMIASAIVLSRSQAGTASHAGIDSPVSS